MGRLSLLTRERSTAIVDLVRRGVPVPTHDLGMEHAATGYTTMATRQEGTVKVAVSPNG